MKDEDGHFWVIGRTDDAINVAGHRLSTMEMESAIMTLDGVAEAAVIGVPDEVKGVVPVAFVTLRQGYEPSHVMEAQVRDAVIRTIGKIAELRTVYFTPAMPKTVSGKIMRRLLRDIVTAGDVRGDVTGLEDPATIEKLRDVVHRSNIAP